MCKPKHIMGESKGLISGRNASVKVILFNSKLLANGEHPIMLKITKNRVRKHIGLGISCTIKQWNKDKELPKAGHPKYSEVMGFINRIEKEFTDKILEFNLGQKDYTIDLLVSAVLKKPKSANVIIFIDELIKTLKEEKRMGTAKANNDCKQMLLKFYPNKNLTFQEIDYSFLNKWESYMRINDFKETSMAVYFRTLRSIVNKAIKEEIVPKTFYAFDSFKISKFDTKTKKRALTKIDMLRVINYQTKIGTKQHDCLNMFKFSYLNQGMNFVDIAYLKWKNIKNNVLEYSRKKTGHDFSIILDENSQKLLEEYHPMTGFNSDNYIFPILNKKVHITPQQEQNRLKKVLRQINSNLKIIGTELGIDMPITTYVARHTYATVLKRSGVSTSIISNALGHESESITQTYLDEFDKEVFFEANKNLM